MQIDKKTIRKVFWVAVGCIFFYWLLHETERFRALWDTVVGIVSPFVIGAALAFILNVPMRSFENRLKFIKNDGLRRAVSIVLTFVALALVIYGVFRLLVPQISETIMTLIPKLTDYFLGLEDKLFTFLENNPELLAWVSANTDFASFDWPSLIQQAMSMLKNSLTVIAGGAFSAVGSVAGGIVDALIGLVFAIYSLARKEILARQGRRILYAFASERAADETIRIMRLTNVTFSNFISGQCLEACILGGLFAVALWIFKMPYIPLVSVIIAVTALIPVVGAFVGCALGAFFILVNDPLQALSFIAMFLVLQQLENNLIYPRVVGTSIGLPGMWVLVAVTLGGELMGVAGMLVMIPMVSVLYTLAREFTDKRLAQRSIPLEKLENRPPDIKTRAEKRQEKKEKQRLQKVKEMLKKLETEKKKES